MASPRTRRVLKDLKIKDDNNVRKFNPILCTIGVIYLFFSRYGVNNMKIGLAYCPFDILSFFLYILPYALSDILGRCTLYGLQDEGLQVTISNYHRVL